MRDNITIDINAGAALARNGCEPAPDFNFVFVFVFIFQLSALGAPGPRAKVSISPICMAALARRRQML